MNVKYVILVLAAIALCCCNGRQKSTTETHAEKEATVTTAEEQADEVEEDIQPTTSWSYDGKGVASFRQLTPDTLTGFSYAPFDISEAYQLNDLKLLFGSYVSANGEFSKHDTETDYGERLVCFNSANQLVFKSHGQCDSYIFIPHFYISDDKKQVVILCQGGTEYYWGEHVFLVENNQVYDIGSVNIETSKEEIPISSVTTIRRVDSTLELSFRTDSLLLDPGGKNEKFVPNKIKLVYKSGKLEEVKN